MVMVYALRYSINKYEQALITVVNEIKMNINSFDAYEINNMISELEYELKHNPTNPNKQHIEDFRIYLRGEC
jgi:hypothetical protein